MTIDFGNNEILDVWAGTGLKVDPEESKKNSGWLGGERPPHEYMNYIQNEFGKQINYLVRSGVPEWNATTDYLENDYATSSGVLYKALADNLNSTPPSADWVAILNENDFGSLAFEDSIPDASETTKGIVEKATTAEMTAGTAEKFPDALEVKNYVDSLSNALPPKFISGFICENDSGDADHDITVSAGKCRDALDTFNIASATSFTKQIDANWADGNNNGGFPSSIILTADTDYYLFEISKLDGTANFGFDSSITATNLLDGSNAGGAGYTKYRRADSCKTDGSLNIIPKKSKEIAGGGIQTWYDTKILETSTCPSGLTNLTISTPLGLEVEAIIEILARETGTTPPGIYLKSNVLGDSFRSTSVDDNSQQDTQVVRIYADTSSQIQHGFLSNSPTTYTLDTLGYIDDRLT